VADESKGRTIAVAAIAATAAVGIAGTAAGWLTARDDRSNQRSLAHDARVYDRRADTYLAALRLIEQQRLQLGTEIDRVEAACSAVARAGTGPICDLSPIPSSSTKVGPSFKPKSFVMAFGRDGYMYARIVAFGSPPVIDGYRRLRQIAAKAGGNENDHWVSKRYAGLPDQLARSAGAFEAAEREFQLRVQRDLG
jgi:hypothetical protein